MRRRSRHAVVGVIPLAALAAAIAGVVSIYGCSSFSSDDTSTDDGGGGEGGPGDEAGRDGEAGAPRALHVVYARNFGGTSDEAGIFSGGLAVGTAGDTHVVASYYGAEIKVDSLLLPAPTSTDAFILDLAANGDTLAVRAVGAADEQLGVSAATTNGDPLYAGFLYKDKIQLGATPHASEGTFNSIVGRFYKSTGLSGEYAILGQGNIQLRSIAVGSSTSALVAGEWDTKLRIDTLMPSFDNTGKGNAVFIARLFAPSGESDAVRVFCDTGTITCTAAALATNLVGDSVVTGRFVGTTTFDGGTLSATDGDAYVVRFDVKLAAKWAISIGGVDNQEGFAAAAIPGSPDFVIAGGFQGVLDAPGIGMRPTKKPGARDIFIARVDEAGKITWLKTFGGTGNAAAKSIVVDRDANIYFGGTFDGKSIDFGGGPLANADTRGVGSTDAYVTWLDGAGNYVYSTRFGGEADDGVGQLALDGDGQLVMIGTIKGAADFGTSHLIPHSGADLFVAKLSR